MTGDRVRGFFDELISEVLTVDLEVADKAAELRSRRKVLRMPDTLILGTAETNVEVEFIVTGDVGTTKVPDLRCQVEILAEPRRLRRRATSSLSDR